MTEVNNTYFKFFLLLSLSLFVFEETHSVCIAFVKTQLPLRIVELKPLSHHDEHGIRSCRPLRTAEYEGSVSEHFSKVRKRAESYF